MVNSRTEHLKKAIKQLKMPCDAPTIFHKEVVEMILMCQFEEVIL